VTDQKRTDTTAFVIAHYDAQGRVALYLRELVAYLRTLTPHIVFVSTNIDPDAADAMRAHAQVIVRENVGYDFWSYKVGIDSLGDLRGFDRLVIFNNSFLVLDPAHLCNCFLEASGNADLLGFTHNRDIQPHLQSYWISFENPQIINSQAFAQWWAQMTPISDKREVIRAYEVGMSTYFGQRGFRLSSMFQRDREELTIALCRAIETGYVKVNIPPEGQFVIDPFMGEATNVTHYSWDALLRRFGFFKLELLRNNPSGVNIHALRAIMNSTDRYRRLLEDVL
jgi:rhamnosyltransferase